MNPFRAFFSWLYRPIKKRYESRLLEIISRLEENAKQQDRLEKQQDRLEKQQAALMERLDSFCSAAANRSEELQDALSCREQEIRERLDRFQLEQAELKRSMADCSSTFLQNQSEIELIRKRQLRFRDEMHRHIDFTYRDLMIMHRYKDLDWSKEAILETDYPIAKDSNDTLVPKGTTSDDTRYPRFIRRCEDLFCTKEKKSLAFLDLGCSGGGMVLEALLRGHYALGLEGSDASLVQQRAEWRLIPEHLKTCDIAKPFRLKDPETNQPLVFDVVTAWEVLEHIPAEQVQQLIDNIFDCLLPGGYFIASIASKPDLDPVTKVDYHVNLQPIAWWQEQFENKGFVIENELFTLYDLARGRYNQNLCWREPRDPGKSDPEKEFHIVARKKAE